VRCIGTTVGCVRSADACALLCAAPAGCASTGALRDCAGSISFLPKSKKAITRVGVMASGFLSWLLIFGYITR
jgi:hypothetical protein